MAAAAFAGVAAEDVSHLLAATRTALRDAECVFSRGDPADSVCFILTGAVRIQHGGGERQADHGRDLSARRDFRRDRHAFEAVDDTVGWAKLLRVRGEVADLAKLAEEDPLLRAANRWKTLRKFVPDLIEVLEFRAIRAGEPMLAALKLLAELNRSSKRQVPPDAPMPFRKDWRRLVRKTACQTGASTRGRCWPPCA